MFTQTWSTNPCSRAVSTRRGALGGRPTREQAAALTEVVRSNAAPVVLVVHSGASYPASVLLDADPDAVSRIVYVDSGPAADGATFAEDLPADIDEVALPPFEILGQRASLAGIDEQRLARFRERAVPEPGGVLRGRLRLSNDARRDVPSTIIACLFPSRVMLSMARDGHPMMAETATLRQLDVVDLPTGHWPMFSRPLDLAEAIAAAAVA